MPQRQSQDVVDSRLRRAATLALLAVLVAFTAWYLLRYSDFSNDDLDNLVLMRHTGFWAFVLMPTDVHYVPLHRLLSWLVYHIDPMNFGVAVTVLLAFHAGTLGCLWASLRRCGLHHARGLFVCAYAASGLIIYGLAWWAHAEHRVPYVFFDALAICQYLAWLDDGRRARLWLAALAFVLACGFYEKAVFIPLHMLVAGALVHGRCFVRRPWRLAWPPLGLALGSAAYVLVYLLLHPASAQATLAVALRGDLEFAKVLFTGALGLGAEGWHDVPAHGASWVLVLQLATALAMVVWSLRRGGGGWLAVLALLLVVMLDNLPIALSNRVAIFGLMSPHQYRFGYEELHLVVLFVGIWWARTVPVPASALRGRVAWATGFVFLLVFAVLQVADLRASRHARWSSLWLQARSHAYLQQLRHGLATIAQPDPRFDNASTPGYLSIFRGTPDLRTLLPLFQAGVRFDDGAGPRYRVQPDGRVVRIQ